MVPQPLCTTQLRLWLGLSSSPLLLLLKKGSLGTQRASVRKHGLSVSFKGMPGKTWEGTPQSIASVVHSKRHSCIMQTEFSENGRVCWNTRGRESGRGYWNGGGPLASGNYGGAAPLLEPQAKHLLKVRPGAPAPSKTTTHTGTAVPPSHQRFGGVRGSSTPTSALVGFGDRQQSERL